MLCWALAGHLSFSPRGPVCRTDGVILWHGGWLVPDLPFFTDLKFCSLPQCTYLTDLDSQAHWHLRWPSDAILVNELYMGVYWVGLPGGLLFSWLKGTVSLGIGLLTISLTCFSCPKLVFDAWVCQQSSCKHNDESHKWRIAEGMIKRIWSLMASWSFDTCSGLPSSAFLVTWEKWPHLLMSPLPVSCYMHLETVLTNTILFFFWTCKISITTHITLNFHYYLFTWASPQLFSELHEGKYYVLSLVHFIDIKLMSL